MNYPQSHSQYRNVTGKYVIPVNSIRNKKYTNKTIWERSRGKTQCWIGLADRPKMQRPPSWLHVDTQAPDDEWRNFESPIHPTENLKTSILCGCTISAGTWMMDVYTYVQHLSCMMFNCKKSVMMWVVSKINLILVKINVREGESMYMKNCINVSYVSLGTINRRNIKQKSVWRRMKRKPCKINWIWHKWFLRWETF